MEERTDSSRSECHSRKIPRGVGRIDHHGVALISTNSYSIAMPTGLAAEVREPSTPLVSVIICSHNRSADVSECVSALIPQINSQAEAILVDSASDPDDQAEMTRLGNLYPTLKLTRV